MTINEMWEKFRKELNDRYEGTTVAEYGQRWGGNNRGPHVQLMIPAKKTITCDCCKVQVESDIPKPTRNDIEGLMGLVCEYLAPVTWDGNLEHDEYRGNIKHGWYYVVEFDKIST